MPYSAETVSVSTIRPGLASLCLAAGRGERLTPISQRLPKPLCPAGDYRLLARAVHRARAAAARVIVNVHHHREMVVTYLDQHLDGVETSVEDRLLGTAGAVGRIRHWLADDDLLIVNADTVLEGDTGGFIDTWDGERLRLLVVADRTRPDFEGVWRYAGVALVPNALAVGLPDRPAHLYDELIAPETAAGRAEVVPVAAFYMDCATPADLLLANLALSGGRTVVSDDAVMAGNATHSLLLPGSRVEADETLEWSIRMDDGRTIDLTAEFGG